jgi:hypothetical protein
LPTENDVPTTPTPVSHTAAAQAMVEQARAMRQQVPHLVFPTSKGEAQRLSNAASVPPEFVRFADAFDPVADELEALAQFIRHSTLAARNKAGSEALTTFAVAKRLAKRPENADLLPHVENMRRALGRTRKGKSHPAAAPEPAPAEPTPETPSKD